jgi:hypothetical protein
VRLVTERMLGLSKQESAGLTLRNYSKEVETLAMINLAEKRVRKPVWLFSPA